MIKSIEKRRNACSLQPMALKPKKFLLTFVSEKEKLQILTVEKLKLLEQWMNWDFCPVWKEYLIHKTRLDTLIFPPLLAVCYDEGRSCWCWRPAKTLFHPSLFTQHSNIVQSELSLTEGPLYHRPWPTCCFLQYPVFRPVLDIQCHTPEKRRGKLIYCR